MASPAAPIASSPREIRVFISSTFRDMQEEREELVRQISLNFAGLAALQARRCKKFSRNCRS